MGIFIDINKIIALIDDGAVFSDEMSLEYDIELEP